MERRMVTTIVSVVVGAVVFLLVYNFTSDDDEATEDKVVDRASANAAVGQDGRTVLPSSGEAADLFKVEISSAGGALRSFVLLKDQFRQKDRTEGAKPYIPAERLQEGPYEVVGTWSPAFYPFQVEFSELDWESDAPEMVRLVRAEGPGTWSDDGMRLTLAEAGQGDLAIRAGDLVKADGFEARVTTVADDGGIAFAEAPSGRPARVMVIRRGGALAQYRADPTYTVVDTAEDGTVTLAWPNPARDTSVVFVERKWRVTGPYLLRHELRVINLGPTSLRAKYRIAANGWVDPFAEEPGMFSPPVRHWSPTCLVNGSHEEEQLNDILEEGGELSFPGNVSWFGINSQFFLLAAVFDKEDGVQGSCALRGNSQGVIAAVFGRGSEDVIPGASSVCVPEWFGDNRGYMTCGAAMAAFGVDAKHLDEASLDRALDNFKGSKDEATKYKKMLSAYREGKDEGRFAFTVVGGPKDLDLLESAAPSLDNTLDFWFVGFLAKPMLGFLKFLHNLVPIWWVAIFLLTVSIRMAMLPLTQKSYVQMQKMKELKPEIDALQKKYGNDKQRLQQEMMNVYKRHNMNPLGGCFPMLLQMPLYFALYRCLYAAVDLYQAPLFGWIADMTQPDPYYVLPAALGVFMFLQQQLMPSTGGDEMQQKIIKYVMPIMFSLFMFMLPSGLVFYIFVSTVISVGQQWWIKRQFENASTGARSKAA